MNHDGLGNLRGYAYGANIGWIVFENAGAPRVDLVTGRLSGHAYSANCGWISLGNAVAHVQTASIAPGADSDVDGIADGWERTYTNTLTAFGAASDTDGDGMIDRQEALADTNPLDRNDNLRISGFNRDGAYIALAWTSKPTRFYRLLRTPDPASPWQHFVTGFDNWPGWNNVGFDDFGTNAFYRIRAVRPLMP